MTYTDTGRMPRRRGHLLSPREFIDKLRAEEPNANTDEIAQRYMAAVREHSLFDDMFWEILVLDPLEEWLRANVVAPAPVRLVPPPAQPPRRNKAPEERARATAETRALVTQIAAKDAERIELVVAIRLLEYKTTYGKTLGDCTGAECARLSRHYGAFFAEIARRINPADRVRNHLSELELQGIARVHRLIGPGAGER